MENKIVSSVEGYVALFDQRQADENLSLIAAKQKGEKIQEELNEVWGR